MVVPSDVAGVNIMAKMNYVAVIILHGIVNGIINVTGSMIVIIMHAKGEVLTIVDIKQKDMVII